MPYKFSTNILFLSNLHPTNKATGMNFSLLKKRQATGTNGEYFCCYNYHGRL